MSEDFSHAAPLVLSGERAPAGHLAGGAHGRRPSVSPGRAVQAGERETSVRPPWKVQREKGTDPTGPSAREWSGGARNVAPEAERTIR